MADLVGSLLQVLGESGATFNVAMSSIMMLLAVNADCAGVPLRTLLEAVMPHCEAYDKAVGRLRAMSNVGPSA